MGRRGRVASMFAVVGVLVVLAGHRRL